MKMLKIAEIAEMLAVHRNTVLRWIHTGELPAIKLGHRSYRIDPEDFRQFMEKRKVKVSHLDITNFR